MISLQPYKPGLQHVWNQTVEQCKNATFLHNRGFMDYHADRFTDCSVLIFDNDRCIALFPANWKESEHTVCSHGGLTYGGLLLTNGVGAVETLKIMSLLTDYYCNIWQARQIILKPTPHIYHTQPADEPLYALFRLQAELTARTLSSAVNLYQPLPLRHSRKDGIRKANKEQITITQTTSEAHFRTFWIMLDQTLSKHHQLHPVHSCSEMILLANRFPDNIKLCIATDQQGNAVAGAWVFITRTVVHTQYLAATEEGRKVGALDTLIAHLIQQHTTSDPHAPHYFDFGISTEHDGLILNEGLAFQKEGFGAKGVCYDIYTLRLK